MDYIAPPLNAVLQIELNIKSGLSVRAAIINYIRESPDSDFARQIETWLFCVETGRGFLEKSFKKKPYRKALLDLLLRGLKGEPILSPLQEFEEELREASMQDLEQQIQKLPFICLIPLFLFQVPSFFLLLLGPLLMELISSFSF